MSGKLRMPTPKTNNLKKSILLRSPPCSPPQKKKQNRNVSQTKTEHLHTRKLRWRFPAPGSSQDYPSFQPGGSGTGAGPLSGPYQLGKMSLNFSTFRRIFFGGWGGGKSWNNVTPPPKKRGVFSRGTLLIHGSEKTCKLTSWVLEWYPTCS